MGVKNGINAFGKKNFTGAFAVPWAVICDQALLKTLPIEVFRAGFSEAVKIALLKDPKFFAEIAASATRIAAHDLAAAQPIIQRSAALHVEHIAQGGVALLPLVTNNVLLGEIFDTDNVGHFS